MTQLHALFKLSSYLDSQEEFLNSILPNLAQIDDIVDLKDIKQFDELLTHLEISFKSNVESSRGNIHPYANLALPSYNVIRILLTLACRCSDSNLSSRSLNIDGIPQTNDYVRSLNEEYRASLSRTPLRSRSLELLSEYTKLITNPNNSDDPIVKLIYKRLMVVLADFITQSRTVKKTVQLSNTKITETQPILKGKRVSIKRDVYTSPTRQSVITNFFPVSPESNRQHNEYTLTQDIPEEISDSEGELAVLGTAANMEEELQKYQQSPIRNYLLDDNNHGQSLQGSFGLIERIKRSIEEEDVRDSDDLKRRKSPEIDHDLPKSRNGRSKITEKFEKIAQQGHHSKKEHPLHKWENIKIFGEDLICRRLNPKLNNQFSLWMLINWTYYCADQATKQQKFMLNSLFTSYHIIYKTYNGLLDILYDLVTFNFFQSIKEHSIIQMKLANSLSDLTDRFFQSSEQSRMEILYHLEDTSFLIHSLLTQLNPFQSSWFDRIIEYVFNGLGIASPSPPSACYYREKLFIQNDRSIKDEYSAPKSWKGLEYNDNIDSIGTRYKFISFIYYRSLFFSDGSSLGYDCSIPASQRISYLNSSSLILELSKKFCQIDFKYLKEFYHYSYRSESMYFPAFYEKSMLIELAQALVENLTGVRGNLNFVVRREEKKFQSADTEDDNQDYDSAREDITVASDDEIQIISTTSIKWQVANYEKILKVIIQSDTYNPIVCGETYKTYGEFEQEWLKLNFLLEWLLDLAFDDFYDLTSGENDVLSFSRKQQLEDGFVNCKEADTLRNKMFEHFWSTQNPNSSFQLPDSKDYFTKLRTCPKFEDIFLNKFSTLYNSKG